MVKYIEEANEQVFWCTTNKDGVLDHFDTICFMGFKNLSRKATKIILRLRRKGSEKFKYEQDECFKLLMEKTSLFRNTDLEVGGDSKRGKFKDGYVQLSWETEKTKPLEMFLVFLVVRQLNLFPIFTKTFYEMSKMTDLNPAHIWCLSHSFRWNSNKEYYSYHGHSALGGPRCKYTGLTFEDVQRFIDSDRVPYLSKTSDYTLNGFTVQNFFTIRGEADMKRLTKKTSKETLLSYLPDTVNKGV